VTVSGADSTWNNSDDLAVGDYGSDNTLTIADGGTVQNGYYSEIGRSVGSDNNAATVTGAGSVWNNSGELRVGTYGSGSFVLAM